MNISKSSKEYIFPKNSMIGGWYIPPAICDDHITFFKDNKKYQKSGKVGPSPVRMDSNLKESLEVAIDLSCHNPSYLQYLKYLKAILDLYIKKYPEVEELSRFGLIEMAQIQYYGPGQGYKTWHFERTTKAENRCLVFMTYLNDVPEGGTHFKYQDLTTPAEKGLTLIWPTDFTHTHKGQISKQHEKYIITGWLGYV